MTATQARPNPSGLRVLAAAADVGVVVPVFNGERWLGTALASLRDQTLTSWIAVIVDDGSVDGTLPLARQAAALDSRIRVVSQANAGVAAARSAGLRSLPAGVDYVAFLDADDRYEPTALQVLRARLEIRPDAVGVYALARYVDPAGAPIMLGAHEAVQRDRRVLVGHRVVSRAVETDVTFETLVVSNPIWPAAVALLRVGDVRATGGPDPSFRVQQDWELYLRLSRRGPFVFVPDTLVDYRRHDANATVTSRQHAFQQDRMRHKAWTSADNTPLPAPQRASGLAMAAAAPGARERTPTRHSADPARTTHRRSAARRDRAVRDECGPAGSAGGSGPALALGAHAALRPRVLGRIATALTNRRTAASAACGPLSA